nr:hypothetical protein [uncultured Cohaesibacter sp.]
MTAILAKSQPSSIERQGLDFQAPFQKLTMVVFRRSMTAASPKAVVRSVTQMLPASAAGSSDKPHFLQEKTTRQALATP